MADAHRARAVGFGDRRQLETVRRDEQLLVARRVLRHGQMVEDAAAAVVEHDEDGANTVPVRGEQPAGVVQEREVATEPDGRARSARRGAEDAGDEAVDAVRAAVAQDANGRRARWPEPVEGADGEAVSGLETRRMR